MGEQKESKLGWAERRREKKRLKLERTGDSPQKRNERKKPGDQVTPEENTRRAGYGQIGF
jgi:hypothetical protein